MSNRHFYVKVAEHLTKIESVPFTYMRDKVPGRVESWRVYGPYTYAGAKRVVKYALSGMSDIVERPNLMFYAHYLDDEGTRVATIWPYNPDTMLRPIRHFPRGA